MLQIYNYYHKADMFDKLFIKDFTIYVNNKTGYSQQIK